MLQLEVCDPAAKQDEEIVVVEKLELVSCVVQQPIAIRMKCVRLQATAKQLARGPGPIHLGIEGLLVLFRIENGGNAVNQFGGGVACVGDGEDFFRLGSFALDEVRDAAGQHGGLAGTGAGNYQHRTMHVFDGLALLIGGNEMVMAVI